MKNNMNADEPKVGWSDYQEITDDTDIELWHEARTSGLGAWRASLKRIILSRKYQRAFKKFQLEKRRRSYLATAIHIQENPIRGCQ